MEGFFKKIIIIGRKSSQPGKHMYAMINPEIVDKSKEIWEEYEGCLSIPKLFP